MVHNGPHITPKRSLSMGQVIDQLELDGWEASLERHNVNDTDVTWLCMAGWWVGVFVHDDTGREPERRMSMRFDHFEIEETSSAETIDAIRAAIQALDKGIEVYLTSIRNGIDEIVFAFELARDRNLFAEYAVDHGLLVTNHDITSLDGLDAAETFIDELTRDAVGV